MRKRIIAGLTLSVLLALPAAAQECAELTIEDGVIVDAPEEDMGVSWALYGPESMTLQIQIGDDRGLGEGVGTHVVLEATSGIATVCPDGSVSFTAAPDPMPVEVVIDDQPSTEIIEAVILSDEIPFAPAAARVSA